MLEICAIASGSNGNCYYIGNEHDAVLIDAGISTKQILQRMYERNLDFRKLRGVIISHEHSDHSLGIRVLSKKLRIPAYFTDQTFKALWHSNQPQVYTRFSPGKSFILSSFIVHPFLKNHDASEPCSFRIEYDRVSIGVFTDIGSPCENVISHLNQCHAVFLETNYDEDMLRNGSYPVYLKKRVGSDVGHLSNKQAFNLLEQHAGEQLRCVFLSHLSAENNRPEIALNEIKPLSGRFDIRLTSRYDAGEVIKFE
jgi:phosphoribosyl 1,2-cyclic phosphodiesterase